MSKVLSKQLMTTGHAFRAWRGIFVPKFQQLAASYMSNKITIQSLQAKWSAVVHEQWVSMHRVPENPRLAGERGVHSLTNISTNNRVVARSRQGTVLARSRKV